MVNELVEVVNLLVGGDLLVGVDGGIRIGSHPDHRRMECAGAHAKHENEVGAKGQPRTMSAERVLRGSPKAWRN